MFVVSGPLSVVWDVRRQHEQRKTDHGRLKPMNHCITISEAPADQLRHCLDVAHRLKKQLKTTGRNDPLLAGKVLAMIFEKPSLRTRVSFAVAMEHLGGMGLVLRPDEVGLGTR